MITSGNFAMTSKLKKYLTVFAAVLIVSVVSFAYFEECDQQDLVSRQFRVSEITASSLLTPKVTFVCE